MNNLIRLPKPTQPYHTQPYHIVIALWLLAMISIPILRWTVGDSALRWGSTVSVALQAVAVLTILWQHWGARRTLITLAILIPASWLVEFVGSTTGLPFGRYHYTDQLMPQIGHVPLIIPLAWLMMLPPAWAIAHAILHKSGSTFSGWHFWLLSGLALTAWDLFLDPQMVGWGFWVWEEQPMFLGGYFGIPWLNFFGWIVSGALLTALVTAVIDLDPLPVRPLLLIYTLTWLLETGGLAVLWGLIGPAICGFIGMGALILWAYRRLYRR